MPWHVTFPFLYHTVKSCCLNPPQQQCIEQYWSHVIISNCSQFNLPAMSPKYGRHLLHQNLLWIKTSGEKIITRGASRESTPCPSLTSRRLRCRASCLLAVCSGNYNSSPFLFISVSHNALQVTPRPNSDSTRGSRSKSDQTWKATRSRGRNGESLSSLAVTVLCLCFFNTFSR